MMFYDFEILYCYAASAAAALLQQQVVTKNELEMMKISNFWSIIPDIFFYIYIVKSYITFATTAAAVSDDAVRWGSNTKDSVYRLWITTANDCQNRWLNCNSKLIIRLLQRDFHSAASAAAAIVATADAAAVVPAAAVPAAAVPTAVVAAAAAVITADIILDLATLKANSILQKTNNTWNFDLKFSIFHIFLINVMVRCYSWQAHWLNDFVLYQ